jgi:hypothetical protein
MHDLESARRESAELLSLDPDKLTPAQALKCDLVSALRLVIDDELGRATSGSGADLSKLIVAVDHLTTFMKDARPAEVEHDPFEDVDPHKHLEDMLRRYWEAKVATEAEAEAERIERGELTETEALRAENALLKDENAHLRGTKPRALPAPDSEVMKPLNAPVVAKSGDETKRQMETANDADAVFAGERSCNSRAADLPPCDRKVCRVLAGSAVPVHLHPPMRGRQRSAFRSVRHELVQHHRQHLGRRDRQRHIRKRRMRHEHRRGDSDG